MQHQNIDLYSCIECESQSFKLLFYLKQIFVITGDPFRVEGPGQLPPFPPPLNPVMVTMKLTKNAAVSR